MAFNFLKYTAVLLWIFSTDLLQAQQHIVPQDVKNPMQMGELVCVELPNGENECGKVVSSGSDFITIDTEGEIKQEPNKKERAPTSKKQKPIIPTPTPSPSPSPTPIAEPIPSLLPSPSPEPISTPVPSPVPSPSTLPMETKNAVDCDRSFASVGFTSPIPESPKMVSYRSAVGGTLAMNAYNVSAGIEKLSISGYDIGAKLLTAFATVRNNSIFVFGIGLYSKVWVQDLVNGMYISPGLNLTFIKATLSTIQTSRSLTALSPYGELGFKIKLDREIDLIPRVGLQFNIPISGDKEALQYSGLAPYLGVEMGIAF